MSEPRPDDARHEERLRLLSEVVGAFADVTTDPDRAFDEIVRRIAETMRDACLLAVVSEDGVTLTAASRYHVSRGRESSNLPQAIPLSQHPLARQVLASKRALLIPRLDYAAMQGAVPSEILAHHAQLGVHSILLVPLRARERNLGFMSLTRDSPTSPPFGEDDRIFAQTLADHAALTILNARAFDTERRGREALAEAERVFFEQSPVSMFVVDIESRRPLAVNQAAVELYGYSREELLDLPVERLRADQATGATGERLRALHVAGVTQRAMSRHVRRDGTEFDVEFVTRPTTFRGRPALVSLQVDVTERLRAAEAKARLASIIDSSEDAIISKTPAGVVTSWNRGAERIFGYRADEIVGKSILTLIPPERHEEEGLIIQRLQQGEFVDHFETERVRKDGRRIDVSVTISPVFDARGALVGASKIARDITDRRRLEEGRRRIEELDAENHRVQEASRLKSRFLANMSHELRTPLNAIIGFAALMRDGKAGRLSETQQEYMGDILTSGRHLLQLINDVLDLAKVEAGRMAIAPEAFDVAASVHHVRDTLGAMIAEKDLNVTTTLDPSLGGIVTDARAFKQILYNYLSNAIKFTPSGGSIAVAVAGDGDGFFRLDVTDSGIGIKPADLRKLFVEFQQLDSGPGKHYQGTGLGLALTKRIVEALGGAIEVSSELGKGSCFSARLPRVCVATAEAAR